MYGYVTSPKAVTHSGALLPKTTTNVKSSFAKKNTPRKMNMEPENTPLEKENHLPNHHFQGLC